MKGIAWVPIIIAVIIIAPPVIVGLTKASDYFYFQDAKNHKISPDDRQLLGDALTNLFTHYQMNCFSKVSDIGNERIYAQELAKTVIAYEPGRAQDSYAEYKAGAIFLNKPVKDIDFTKIDNQDTIWHELTHALEADNSWDKWMPQRLLGEDVRKAYDERHTDYTRIIRSGVLDTLIGLEKGIRDGTIDARSARIRLSQIQKSFESGSVNSYQSVPSDLKQFSAYTGWHVDFTEILNLYKSGSCIKFPDGTFDTNTSQGIVFQYYYCGSNDDCRNNPDINFLKPGDKQSLVCLKTPMLDGKVCTMKVGLTMGYNWCPLYVWKAIDSRGIVAVQGSGTSTDPSTCVPTDSVDLNKPSS